LVRSDQSVFTLRKKQKSWATYHANSLLASANYYGLLRKSAKAESLYRLSINHNRWYKRKFELGVSLFEYGSFLTQIGKEKQAKSLWKEAYSIFEAINSKIYQEKLKERIGINQYREEDPIRRFVTRINDHQISDSLIELSQYLRSNLHLDALMDKILNIGLKVSKAQRVILFICNEQTGELVVQAEKNIDLNVQEPMGFSKKIVLSVLQSGEPIITSDASEDEDISQYQSVIKHQLKSILCFPVKYREEVKGVCYLDNIYTCQAFSQVNMDILNALMTQAIITIENHRLHHKNKAVSLDEPQFMLQCEKYKITRREKEILNKIIKGLTNRDIGEQLSISVSTVKKHLYNIYSKTNAGNREKLIETFSS